jgi:hypothetical protein
VGGFVGCGGFGWVGGWVVAGWNQEITLVVLLIVPA